MRAEEDEADLSVACLLVAAHRLPGSLGVDAVVVNPGAWTHYAWAIHDALEPLTIPIIEVHLSNVDEREEWRRTSVVSDLVAARFAGHGPDGYKLALDHVKERQA